MLPANMCPHVMQGYVLVTQLKGPLKFVDQNWLHDPCLLGVPRVGESKLGAFGARGLSGALGAH